MAEQQEKQERRTSDYLEVVGDIYEEVMARLTMDDDGTIIDLFQTGSFDPWQLFVFFGAVEKALADFRTDRRCKTVLVHVQPEDLAGVGRVVTPMYTLIEHVLMQRLDDVSAGRLELGSMVYNGEAIEYEGVDLKGRHVVILSDVVDAESPYLKECISMCREMKATHTVALPLMVWNPELIDNLSMDSVKEEFESNENHPVS